MGGPVNITNGSWGLTLPSWVFTMLLGVIGVLLLSWGTWVTADAFASVDEPFLQEHYISTESMGVIKEEIIGEIHLLKECVLRDDC